jgi:catechol 2,3-dioxygenase-like lactoylglutathione lyase family enzyme
LKRAFEAGDKISIWPRLAAGPCLLKAVTGHLSEKLDRGGKNRQDEVEIAGHRGMAMADLTTYEARREELKERYLQAEKAPSAPIGTGGVDHLALISSDLDATIQFYTEVLGMHLTRIVANRDEPTSTHIFLDMGGGNLLAFFDFPEKSSSPAVRGIGSMHHVALKGTAAQYGALLARLKERKIPYSLHGSEEKGAVYMRDPDNVLVEVTTGY